MHRDARSIYSQTGEDLLIQIAIRSFNVDKPTYLDIGANHPTFISNTFRFYQNGSHGVCVEPNPDLARIFKRKRPLDTVLAVAVGTTSEMSTLYIASNASMSTTSSTQADYINNTDKFNINKEICVPTKTIMSIINEYFPNTAPDIISMDIEGMDFYVLQTFDFNKCRPLVFCIETLAHDKNGNEIDETEINRFMMAHGYFSFANTHLSTIFVNKQLWDEQHPQK